MALRCKMYISFECKLLPCFKFVKQIVAGDYLLAVAKYALNACNLQHAGASYKAKRCIQGSEAQPTKIVSFGIVNVK